MDRLTDVYLLSGIPGSGKSRYAYGLEELYGSQEWGDCVKIISSDEIRFTYLPKGYYHATEVTDDYTYQKFVEQATWKEYEKQLIEALENKHTYMIILDATHNQYRWWKKWVEIIRRYKVNLVGVDFIVSPEYAIRRDNQRERHVGEKVIMRMWESKQPLSYFKHLFDQLIIIQ